MIEKGFCAVKLTLMVAGCSVACDYRDGQKLARWKCPGKGAGGGGGGGGVAAAVVAFLALE